MTDFLSIVFDDLHLRDAEYLFLSTAKPWSAHISLPNRAVFHAVLQGHVECAIGDELFDLSAGDILIIPGAKAHQIRMPKMPTYNEPVDISQDFKRLQLSPMQLGEGEFDSLILSASCLFDEVMGAPLISALPTAMPIRGMAKHPPNWLRIGIEFLLDEMSDLKPGHQAILNRLGDIWFLECLRTYITELPEGNETWLRALKDPLLGSVLSKIHQYPAQPWTVNALAEVAHLSRSAFAERFIRCMSMPPLTYVTEHRMRIAVRELTHSAQPIRHIAEQVGYSSENAFGQAFKRIHGCSPGQYRERIRKNDTEISD